ncbi:MAG: 4-alpha-glucanotransferase [Prevotellaceae bacterium]|nr:4-alpha-glucanotransferase [Prevotellaceae bacterium]
MNLKFNINYRTRFGEELVLNIINGDTEARYRMMTADGERWTFKLNLPAQKHQSTLVYYYEVERGGQKIRCEWTTIRHMLELTAVHGASYTIFDRWSDIPEDSYLYSSAFTNCVRGREPQPIQQSSFGATVRLVVRAPQLRSDDRLAVIGKGDALGNWDATKAIPMTEHQFNEWVVDIDTSKFTDRKLEFKFIAVNTKNQSASLWETGYNRTIELPLIEQKEVIVYNLDQAFFPLYNVRLAGTLVPVFSLRSEGSFGVGDFGDLKSMINLVYATGQRVLQILPVNDTTTTHSWQDSYPYSCISIFGIHPQYVDLRQLPALTNAKQRNDFEALREQLNALPQIDYEQVNTAKIKYLRLLFAQEGSKVLSSKGFKQFMLQAGSWLVPYAQYCVLRDKYGTACFSQWPDHNTWNEADRDKLLRIRSQEYHEASFWYYVQYILHNQLLEAHKYARKKHVILKGDIPIGVSRYGCDVWTEPRYFNLNGQAGAPPDDFSVNGQNWGFPTYNWDAMLKDGCQWWIRRFQNMAQYFDAYRIDHVLGFFRIWEIPVNAVHGLLGQFQPSLGMTREEIESYGLSFLEHQFCDPFIANWVLDRIFYERADEVKTKYLDYDHDDIWKLKPAYDTQRKIEKAFDGVTDEHELHLRDGLYSLVSDVLFVRDHKDNSKFHPRISAQFNFTYEALYDNDKAAFNRLYNDYFYRRNNQFWYDEAMKKLPVLVQATRMLVCAEDLGMVPDCVSWVMNELRVLSLEIQSMPKDPHVRFGHLNRNPYRSVCTFSTHDMPTLRQWWDEDISRTQDYFNTMLYHEGPAPHPLPGWLARDIVSRQLASPSMLCVLSIQDWLAMDERIRLKDADAERINIPANPHYYWRYRMHVSIEKLMNDASFTENVRDLVKQSGR